MKELKITYPFDSSLSKNKMWRVSRFGHHYLSCKHQLDALTVAIAFEKAIKKVNFAPSRKESKESVLTNSTPDWHHTINVLDYLYDWRKVSTAL